MKRPETAQAQIKHPLAWISFAGDGALCCGGSLDAPACRGAGRSDSRASGDAYSGVLAANQAAAKFIADMAA